MNEERNDRLSVIVIKLLNVKSSELHLDLCIPLTLQGRENRIHPKVKIGNR